VRIKRDPATGDIHHVDGRRAGYEGWEDFGPVPGEYHPLTHRFDADAGRYVVDTAPAMARLKAARAARKAQLRSAELAALAGVPASVAAQFLAESGKG
jgi:hypothetical protein